MAVQPLVLNEIGFKVVELFKDQTLGIGSYGKVCRAKCDNLDCAAKLLHETLFDRNAELLISHRREHRLPLRRFEKECEFLNAIKHPNIIQYLGLYQDPSSGLAVLLMELMDGSLTNYLETSVTTQAVVPYHIQVNLCHDITLALSFLHSNEIIHRDLSGNNVLLSGQPNVRAKVTDFGMASLSNQLSPRTSYLTYTMCPGTDAYMPPEAVKDQPMYSKKIDCFSFGVIVVQILTRKFPKPGDRLKKIQIDSPQMSNVTAYVPVSEYERRQDHISEADRDNPLLPVALDCLKDRDVERPSAQQLCERIVDLRETLIYRESTHLSIQTEHFANSSSNGNDRVIRELQQQLHRHRLRVQELHQTCQSQEERFNREVTQRDELIEQHERIIAQKDALLEEKEEAVVNGQRELQLIGDQLREVSHDKEHLEECIHTLRMQHIQEVQGLQQAIQNQAEQLTQEIEQRDQMIKDQRESLDQKEITIMQREQTLIQRDKTIDAGQQEIQILKQKLDQERTHQRKERAELERLVLKLRQQLSNRKDLCQFQYPTPAMVTVMPVRGRGENERSFSLRWSESRNMPFPVERGCDAVVKDTIVYFLVAGTSRIYNFSTTDNTCFSLPNCPYSFCSLAIVNDLLTAVGGSQSNGTSNTKSFSNKLFSFTDVGVWTEKFPHMPTKRDSTSALCVGTALIVTGGRDSGGGILKTVEVLNTGTLQWSTAPSLPLPMETISTAVCGGDMYLLGGVDKNFFGSKVVFTSSVSALVKSCEPKSLGARLVKSVSPPQVWNRVADLPVTKSTCVSFCGYLLAVGGEDSDYAPTRDIHVYNPMLNSWKVISRMSVARSNCVVASLPGNRLMVGGRAGAGRNNNTEIAYVV